MIMPDHIIKSSRSTLSLTVQKDGIIVVRAPNKIKDEHIQQFVLQKQNWLAEKLASIKLNQNQFKDITEYQKFLLYGARYSLKVADVKNFETSGQDILCPKKLPENKLMHSLILFYKRKAKDVLTKRLNYLKGLLKIEPTAVKITGSKGRWGSCNSRQTIALNWRVIMLPPACIDYVIVHELCHLVELNHSKRFWSLVGAFMPNFSQHRQTINHYAFLLDLYRE